jgi:tetraacyldisaccharide 4'-kinase
MRQPDFWSRDDFNARLLASALAPLGFLYGASVRWKHRLQKPYRAAPKVVCVGNLTAGGGGKTPVAIAIGQMLQIEGLSVAYLLRGYARRSRGALRVDLQTHNAAAVGDEALLLAKIAPTIVSDDRAEGARLAEREGADIIIMDDGHQNFTLAKDLSLVVVDAESGFGNCRIIPAGPLREPVRQGLDRADAVILMGSGRPPLPGFTAPVLHARLLSDRCLGGEPLVAFAGIGRPDKFFTSLRALGAKLVETHGFADHHVYSTAEIALLRERARNAGATLMTTEKDLVRMNAGERAGIDVLPVKAAFDAPRELERLFAAMFNNLN